MNPKNDDEPPLAFEPLTEDELRVLELRWYEGRMLPFADWLFAFVDRNRDEILRLAGGEADPDALLATTRLLIVRRGSVHLAAELTEQMHEIENELWYRGEKGEHDRTGIKLDWTTRHAAAWRRWRIREYLFVADCCASRVVARLVAGAEDLGSGSV